MRSKALSLQAGRIMRDVRFAAVSVLFLVLMLAAASPAFAGISDFAINGDATLAPGDLQVSTTGTVMCRPGEQASILVTVVQFERRQQVAKAFGSTNFFLCTGALETRTVTGVADIPMRSGPASATASAFALVGPMTFETALTSAELKLQETH
jgi:hypothetical protein